MPVPISVRLNEFSLLSHYHTVMEGEGGVSKSVTQIDPPHKDLHVTNLNSKEEDSSRALNC